MYPKVLVKSYKAKCLRHLTSARLAIEQETDNLVKQLYRSSISRLGATLDNNFACKSYSDMQQQVKMRGELTPPPLLSLLAHRITSSGK